MKKHGKPDPRKPARKKRRKTARGRYRDKYQLYQASVQDPPNEVKFIRRVYRRFRKKDPVKLREDFCGTAILACEWVRRIPDGRAVGIDLDPETLEYARAHSLPALGPKASRVTLIRGDVLKASGFRPDVVAAFNFSYYVFKKRAVLKQYFRRVRGSLARDGIFVMDCYGGPEAQMIQEEETEQDGFTYVWDQVRYNPITGETLCRIHFVFPDGTRMKNAFTYDWRLWTLPELRDLLEEVGFKRIEVYWEGTDEETGGGNGVFRPSMKGDDSVSWIAYVVAVK